VPDTFSHSTALAVAPEVAWRALQDPHTWAAIAGVGDVRDTRYADDGTLAGYNFTVSAGIHTITGAATTVEVDPPALMRLDIHSAEMAGWVRAILSEGDATPPELTVTLEMRPKGLLTTMFYPLIAQAVGREFPNQVQGFADRLNGR
jgi:carbon monoxide dehydrogenase subunit G